MCLVCCKQDVKGEKDQKPFVWSAVSSEIKGKKYQKPPVWSTESRGRGAVEGGGWGGGGAKDTGHTILLVTLEHNLRLSVSRP